MLRPALFAFALAIAAPAFATPVKQAGISGAWAFITKPYGDGCQLSGSMQIKPVGKAYTCTFNAQERCPGINIKAQETCTITRTGDALTLTATVKRVTPQVGYVPDHFVLTVQNSNSMVGELRSFHNAPAEFFRGDAPVS
jgi:hypothetical protein